MNRFTSEPIVETSTFSYKRSLSQSSTHQVQRVKIHPETTAMVWKREPRRMMEAAIPTTGTLLPETVRNSGQISKNRAS